MNDLLAAALRLKLAALPFTGSVYGLIRIAEELRTDPTSGDARLIRYPVPLDTPEPCAAPAQLLPNGTAGAAFWFEDEGTALSSSAPYKEVTATLRLLGWLNTARLSAPLAQATLLRALVDAVEGALTVEGLANLRVKATNLAPGDGATLLGRYTLTDDTRPLLRAPFVFFGVTLKATGYLSGCPADLPTLEAAAVC